MPRKSFIAKADHEFCQDLKDMKTNDSQSLKAFKLGKYYHVLVKQSDTELLAPSTSSKYRQSGEGWNAAILEVRQALCDWFVDMSDALRTQYV